MPYLQEVIWEYHHRVVDVDGEPWITSMGPLTSRSSRDIYVEAVDEDKLLTCLRSLRNSGIAVQFKKMSADHRALEQIARSHILNADDGRLSEGTPVMILGRGRYSRDIGFVKEVRTTNGRITQLVVWVIPRLDQESIALGRPQRDGSFPPRLFYPSSIPRSSAPVPPPRVPGEYESGFLKLNVNPLRVTTSFTMREESWPAVVIFQQHLEWTRQGVKALLDRHARLELKEGARVKIRGETLPATVVSAIGSVVVVQRLDGTSESLSIEAVRPRYAVGDTVSVRLGTHAGRWGFVVGVEDDDGIVAILMRESLEVVSATPSM